MFKTKLKITPCAQFGKYKDKFGSQIGIAWELMIKIIVDFLFDAILGKPYPSYDRRL